VTAVLDPVAVPVLERTVASRRRLSHRRRRITIAVAVLAGVLFVLTLGVGSTWIPPWDVVTSLAGTGESTRVDFVVKELRLPAAVTGLAVGFAFGLAGPLFQRMLRNPLASPDFVGVNAGASLFAASAIALFHVSGLWVSGSALVGAAASSLLIYVLAWRDGITGLRFILIGVGVSEFMLSLVGYLLARADIWDARAAMTWLIGSVGNAGESELRILCVVVVLALPLVLVLDRSLRALELGDEQASTLGSRVERDRFALILLGVVLVGSATAAAGPIPFVALMAGPISTRLLRPADSSVLAAGFVGACLVLTADLVANYVMPVPLPTGVVTGLIGAPYLVWLLITVNSREASA
jgi:iron complex transport system permease protein